MTVVFILNGASSPFTSPSDWNNSSNTIETLGAGGAGSHGSSNATSGAGGGGGAYNKITNFTFAVPGTTTAQFGVGAGGSGAGTFPQNGGDTWFNSAAFPTSGTAVGSRGGSSPTSNTSTTGGAGGLAANGFPTTSPPGRDAGSGANSGGTSITGGGGGGSGGPNGTGSTGSTTTGGAADGGTVAGGSSGSGTGNSGTEFDATHGCGSGGGGSTVVAAAGGLGGTYGGGGGGGSRVAGTGGNGGNGLIILTYTPTFIPNAGWHIPPFQPPSGTTTSRRYPGIKGRGGFAAFPDLLPTGWMTPPFQPSHPRPERAAAIMVGGQGTEAPFVAPKTIWGWDIAPQPLVHPPQPAGLEAAMFKGDDGVQLPFIQFLPNDWDIHPFQPPHPPLPPGREAAIFRGDEGTQFPFIMFFPYGWEIPPPQPRHPRPEAAGAIMPSEPGVEAKFAPTIILWGWEGQSWAPRYTPNAKMVPDGGDQGTQSPFVRFFPYGWEIPPPLTRDQIFRSPEIGDQGTQAPFTRWVNGGWEVPPPQPPHPRPERSASWMVGDQGTEAVFVPPAPVNWGWQVAAPDLVVNVRGRYPGLRGSSQFPIFSTWINYGWDIPSFQPSHPRFEKSGAIATSEPGVEAVFVPPVVNPWGWDVPTWQPPAFSRRSFAGMVRGADGIDAPFITWFNSGWEVAPFQPPHPRPERAATLAGGDQGSEFPLIRFFPYGWEIAPPQPPHPRPERAGAIMPSEPGIENIFAPPIRFPEGWQIPPFQPSSVAQRINYFAGIVRGQDGTDFPLIRFFPTGWEIAPHQPQHPRIERAGAIMPWEAGIEAVYVPPAPILWGWDLPAPHLRQPTTGRYFGIEGTADFAFFTFQPYGWEIAPWQPPHPRPERSAPLITSEPGIENVFVPPVVFREGWQIPPFQPPTQASRLDRFAGIVRGQDGTEFPFINWLNAGWEIPPFQPPHRAPEWKAASLFKGDEGVQAQFIRWLNMGWEIPPYQPPHPRPERAGAIMVGHQGTDAVYVFVPPAARFRVDPRFITWGEARVYATTSPRTTVTYDVQRKSVTVPQ